MSTGKKVAALGWKPLNFAVSGATLLALRSQLGNGHKPLSDILIRDLTAHRTLGLRLALNEQPEVAIVAVTHALSAQIFYRGADAHVLDIRPVSTVLASHADGIEDTKAGKAWADWPRPLGGADATQRVRSFGYACSAVVRKKEPQCVDHFDSLLRFRNSLFVRIVSLVVCVGNCRRSACSTEVSCSETDPHRPKTAKFPVKFPVTRETAWRQVRSALRRQGGSLVRTATFRLTERLSLGRSAVQPLCGTVIEPKGTSGPPVWRAVRRDPV